MREVSAGKSVSGSTQRRHQPPDFWEELGSAGQSAGQSAAQSAALSLLLLGVGLDVGEVGDGLVGVAGDDHQGGRLLDAVLGHQILVLLADHQLVVSHAGLVQEHPGGLAVGAGGGGEQDGLDVGGGSVTDGDGLCGLGGGVLGQGLLTVQLALDVDLTGLELGRLTVVPVLDGTVVAGDAAVYLGLLTAVGAGVDLTGDVAVGLAHAVGGRHGVVGQLAESSGPCGPDSSAARWKRSPTLSKAL